MNGWIEGKQADRWSSWQPEIEKKKSFTLYGSLVPSGESVTLTCPNKAPLVWPRLISLTSSPALPPCFLHIPSLIPPPHLCCRLCSLRSSLSPSCLWASRPAGLCFNTPSSRKPSLLTLSNFLPVTQFISMSGFTFWT